LVAVSRRRLGYVSCRKDADLVGRLKELAAAYPRYGYRRLHVMLQRQLKKSGDPRKLNVKRVRRLCRLLRLSLKAKRRRKRRGQNCGMPCKAEYPNHVWAYDFLEDRTERGRKLRILTVEDEFTRKCLEIEVEHRMNAKFVVQTLLELFKEHGVPVYVRSDNGPEFIARALMAMLQEAGVECRHIEPGSPWQNGINERFNGSYRDECANMNTFHNRDHARALSKLYKREYNQVRPHSSLGYQTPAEFAQACGAESAGRLRNKEEEQNRSGALPPNPRDLALCAPQVGGLTTTTTTTTSKGPRTIKPTAKEGSRASAARPRQPSGGPSGAPVASQQSRILRRTDQA
jgi:putative transposase